MDTLQIQDAFTPYYAKPDAIADRHGDKSDATALSREKLRQRLELCRMRLARAIDAGDIAKA